LTKESISNKKSHFLLEVEDTENKDIIDICQNATEYEKWNAKNLDHLWKENATESGKLCTFCNKKTGRKPNLCGRCFKIAHSNCIKKR